MANNRSNNPVRNHSLQVRPTVRRSNRFIEAASSIEGDAVNHNNNINGIRGRRGRGRGRRRGRGRGRGRGRVSGDGDSISQRGLGSARGRCRGRGRGRGRGDGDSSSQRGRAGSWRRGQAMGNEYIPDYLAHKHALGLHTRAIGKRFDKMDGNCCVIAGYFMYDIRSVGIEKPVIDVKVSAVFEQPCNRDCKLVLRWFLSEIVNTITTRHSLFTPMNIVPMNWNNPQENEEREEKQNEPNEDIEPTVPPLANPVLAYGNQDIDESVLRQATATLIASGYARGGISYGMGIERVVAVMFKLDSRTELWNYLNFEPPLIPNRDPRDDTIPSYNGSVLDGLPVPNSLVQVQQDDSVISDHPSDDHMDMQMND